LVAAKALGIPSVLIVRESLMSNPNLRGVLPRRLRRRLLARWATKVLVISEYVRSQFIRDSEVIWPPADLARAICKGTDDPGATIALIGSVSAEKGQLDFVEVAERVVAALPGVKFEMWGSGASDSLRRLKRRIRRSPAKNNILYGGETNDAMGVMSRSILTVSCSRNEGFGKTTLESIAVGTPVVGYDAGGTREILADGGGCLVEANPEAMAAKIVLLLRSPEKMRSLRETCEDHPAIAKGLSAASDAIEAIEDLASSRRE
jgi:glycosyltransferase involved in cell wall biosynthesis